ncbi:hypothetical protein BHM03_00037908 [Ensete ventricosum]|uniref:Uncharacterized protein n=1 Tax=Ensete ventricosum TaxID=4639 RepID=A0A445MJV1_ENSVE|nr:hypothetical protein BHM03_00037908 [Ensete ventricosum]
MATCCLGREQHGYWQPDGGHPWLRVAWLLAALVESSMATGRLVKNYLAEREESLLSITLGSQDRKKNPPEKKEHGTKPASTCMQWTSLDGKTETRSSGFCARSDTSAIIGPHRLLWSILLLENLSREIIYPCIPYLDGEDEGGQTTSSLAVSTRWISAARLLQSDLATLAQREGGE